MKMHLDVVIDVTEKYCMNENGDCCILMEMEECCAFREFPENELANLRPERGRYLRLPECLKATALQEFQNKVTLAPSLPNE